MRTSTVRLRSARASGLAADLDLRRPCICPMGPPDGRCPARRAGGGTWRRQPQSQTRRLLPGSVPAGFRRPRPRLPRARGQRGRADGPLEQDILAAAAFLRAVRRRRPASLLSRLEHGRFLRAEGGSRGRFTALALLCPASEQVILDALDGGARTAMPRRRRGAARRPDPLGRSPPDGRTSRHRTASRWPLAYVARCYWCTPGRTPSSPSRTLWLWPGTWPGMPPCWLSPAAPTRAPSTTRPSTG